ncbi:hypothetical protein QQP08_007867 [Theobroma cacao]|nr:hypothetical protein QQP08_007867 [Theobroma cacao]
MHGDNKVLFMYFVRNSGSSQSLRSPPYLLHHSQPPIPQLAVMDTGSSLLWVQCLLCLPNAPSGMVPYIILQTPQHILDCHAILSVVSFPNVLSPCASRPIHVYTTRHMFTVLIQ